LEKHEKDKTENFVQAVDASYESRPDLTSAYKEPRSPMEMEIAQIWESLLGIRSIGLEDDFFELGGHSLLATQVLSRIEYKYQIKISLKEIFYEFTISKIVEILNSKMNQLEFHTLLRKWGLL
jgi:acyl carrier protein